MNDKKETCPCDPEMERMIRDMHLALIGDEKLGISGAIKDIQDIKAWRKIIDIRVAAIAGGVTGVTLLIKALSTLR